MATTYKNRIVIFAAVLAFSIVACNLLTIGEDSASSLSTPTIQASSVPAATAQGFELTALAEDDAPSTQIPDSTPTTLPLNTTASGLLVTQVTGIVNTFERLEVVGMIQNQTDRIVDMIEVEVQIMDAGDNVIYTDKTFTALDHLTPGEESPFSLTVKEDIAAPSSYNAYVVGNGTIDDLRRTDVQIKNMQMVIDDDGDIYVAGELLNDNHYPVIVNSLAAATFDEEVQILTANYQSVLHRYLDPDQSGYFRVSMSGPISGPDIIDTYSVYLDAIESEPLVSAPISVTMTNEYVDIYGNYHLVGEVTNLGDIHYYVSLVAGVYDNQGNIADAADLSLSLETLAPDEPAPFDFVFWGPLNYNQSLVRTIESHNIVVDNFWTWSTDTGMLNLTTLENAKEEIDEVLYFTGQIVNRSSGMVDSAVVVIIMRDFQSGDVLATNFDYTYEELEPGATYDYSSEIPLWKGIDIDSVVINYLVKGTQP